MHASSLLHGPAGIQLSPVPLQAMFDAYKAPSIKGAEEATDRMLASLGDTFTRRVPAS